MASNRGLYYPFEIIQGETFAVSVVFSIDGVTQSFVDYNFVGVVKDAADNVTTIANLTFTQNVEEPDYIDIGISEMNTSTMQTGTHLYEVKATRASDGHSTTLLYGTFLVKRTLLDMQYPEPLQFDR